MTLGLALFLFAALVLGFLKAIPCGIDFLERLRVSGRFGFGGRRGRKINKETKVMYERRVAEIRLKVAICITIPTLVTALYLIVFTNNIESQKWAYGVMGLLIGYWLK